MSRARTLSKLFNTDGNLNLSPVESINGNAPFGRKNLIINGDQRIAQRGIDLNGKKENVYIADRYLLRTYNASSVGSFNYDQVTDTVPDGFKYSTKLTVATAATDVGTYGYSVEHRIEGYNMAHLRLGRSDAKSFTVSFWARSSLAGTYTSSLRTTSAEYSYVTTFTLVADTWKYVSFTVPALTTSLSNLDETTGPGLLLQIAGFGSQTAKETSTLNSWQSGNFTFADTQTNWMGTSGNTFHFTGVQLEVGDQATDFEYSNYGEELKLCERYYQRHLVGDQNGNFIMVRFKDTTNEFVGGLNFQTTMRTTPTGGNDSVNRFHKPAIRYDTITTLSVTGRSVNGAYVSIAPATDDGASGNRMGVLGSSSGGGYLTFDAEL